jgi:low temperature requirement protein LtrA
VTNVELFFDLVYVFAIVQLSEHLLEHLTVRGGLQTGVLFLAIWWAWNYTAWATNWLDPDTTPVVLLMAVLMAISLVMSAAITEAFQGRGEPFALAYVALQVVRGAFVVWAFGLRARMGRNYAQLLAWSVIAGVLWIIGGLVHGHDTRLVIWAVAVVLDLAAPLHGFWLPGLGGTPIEEWTLAGGHLAERCQLVLMIAFGETVLRIGEALVAAHGAPGVDAAFIVGFGLIVALWSIYFLSHAEHGAERIESSPAEAARLGRSAYAYAHGVMVGGIVVVAVAVHLALLHPKDSAHLGFLAVCVGGPSLYIAGITLFKHSLSHGRVGPPLAGIAAFVAAGAVASLGDCLIVLIVIAAVAVVLAVSSEREDRAVRRAAAS